MTTILLIDGRRFLAATDTIKRESRKRIDNGMPYEVLSACGSWADEPDEIVWASWLASRVEILES